jgi:uncharacterized membrane protein
MTQERIAASEQQKPAVADLGIAGRVEELERRVTCVEGALAERGLLSAEGRVSSEPPMRVERHPPAEQRPRPAVSPMPVMAPPPPPLPNPVRTTNAHKLEHLHGVATPVAVSGIAPRPALRPVPAPALAPAVPAEILHKDETQDMESMIGKNWTSWVGAVVVVLGVCFFLKYAWDQGWLVLPPAARVWLSIAAGAGSIAVGQWVGRKSMRVLSASLMGLGLAISMAGCFAANVLFEPAVFSQGGALAGVIITAGVGTAMAFYGDVMTLAIIALLGAYLGPAVLSSHQDQSLALMAYLAALASVGWALSYLKPRWGALRIFVWFCTGTWMLIWFLSYGTRVEHRGLAVSAVTFFYLGFLAESFLSLRRAFRDGGGAPDHAVLLDGTLATLSMLNTAAAFGGLFAVLGGGSLVRAEIFAMQPMAAVAIGLAFVQTGIALISPARQFGRSAVIQAAVLLTLAVPLAFGQFAITLGWLVLAGGLAVLASKMKNADAVRGWSAALLGLALARVFTFDFMNPDLRRALTHVMGQPVTGWLLLAWAAAVAAHGIAWLVARAEKSAATLSVADVELGAMIAWAGTACFAVAGVATFSGSAVTLLGCALLGGLVALARRGAKLGYGAQAIVVGALVGFKWVAFDGVASSLMHWSHPAPFTMIPVFNTSALCGAVLIGLTAWLVRQTRGDVKKAATECLVILAFAWLNFEALRLIDFMGGGVADVGKAKHVALSVLWGLVGLAAVIIGFARDVRNLRIMALWLLGVTLLKIMIIDMAQVQAIYRILSFIGVGVVLLCVSYVYHRQMDGRPAAS